MTPREILDTNQCNLEHQRALITYNVLFNGPLIISDSDYISNQHFREAIRQGNPFFRALIEEGFILFAIRHQDTQPVSMGKTAEDIFKRGGHTAWPGRSAIPPEQFGDSPEFDFVERNAQLIPFSLDQYSTRYQAEVLRVFRETSFRAEDLPTSYVQAILEICQEWTATGKSITWSFFTYGSDFWKALEQRFPGGHIFERYGQFIFDVARGPYVTFLPQALGVNPTYSREDRLGVNIWRGRYELTEEELLRITLRGSRINLADMAAGPAKLEAQDIRRLRISPALFAYEQACEEFSQGRNTANDTLGALGEYRHEVESAILNALHRRFSSETVAEQYHISGLSKIGQECLV